MKRSTLAIVAILVVLACMLLPFLGCTSQQIQKADTIAAQVETAVTITEGGVQAIIDGLPAGATRDKYQGWLTLARNSQAELAALYADVSLFAKVAATTRPAQ